jgi:hypothetical protein
LCERIVPKRLFADNTRGLVPVELGVICTVCADLALAAMMCQLVPVVALKTGADIQPRTNVTVRVTTVYVRTTPTRCRVITDGGAPVIVAPTTTRAVCTGCIVIVLGAAAWKCRRA